MSEPVTPQETPQEDERLDEEVGAVCAFLDTEGQPEAADLVQNLRRSLVELRAERDAAVRLRKPLRFLHLAHEEYLAEIGRARAAGADRPPALVEAEQVVLSSVEVLLDATPDAFLAAASTEQGEPTCEHLEAVPHGLHKWRCDCGEVFLRPAGEAPREDEQRIAAILNRWIAPSGAAEAAREIVREVPAAPAVPGDGGRGATTGQLVTLRAIADEPDNPKLQEQWATRLQGMAMAGLVWRFTGGPWHPTDYGLRVLAAAAPATAPAVGDEPEPPTPPEARCYHEWPKQPWEQRGRLCGQPEDDWFHAPDSNSAARHRFVPAPAPSPEQSDKESGT